VEANFNNKPEPSVGLETKAEWSLKDIGETERSNVLGFFALLLKVDKRVNPHLYATYQYNKKGDEL
jgi:hypothetical protein